MRKLADKADRLRELCKQPLTLNEIAAELGVSRGTVSNEIKLLGIKRDKLAMPRHYRRLDITGNHDLYSHVIGIAWGIGTVSGDSFLIRHKNRQLLTPVEKLTKSAAFELKSRDSWCVKIALSHPLYLALADHGWQARWDAERGLPSGDINKDEFVRGYISVHHTLDTTDYKGKPKERLRIYGARTILEGIDDHFVAVLGTTPKRIQEHSQSDVCHIIHYQSQKEIPIIKRFLGI